MSKNELLDNKLVSQFISPLIEDTTGAGDPNIESTDDNLTADQIFQQTQLPSLGRQIFSVIPINGPTAGIFNLRKKSASNDFELVRNNVEVYPSESIKTNVTEEALQDMQSMYGQNYKTVLGSLLRGLANEQENTRTIEFLEANSKDFGTIAVSDYGNAEINLFEISQPVQQMVLQINNKNLRTYDAFCVIPATVLGGIMALKAYAGADNKDYRGLFITELGNTRFYLNPDPTSNMGYVGLKDEYNPSKSSAIFSPYQSTIVESFNKDTGEPSFYIFNRFAITASPLHVTDDEMLYKFTVA